MLKNKGAPSKWISTHCTAQSNGLKSFFKEDYYLHNVPHSLKDFKFQNMNVAWRSHKNAGYVHENTNAPPERISIYCDSTYSGVHISSDEVCYKILKKPSIVQKKMIPHMKAKVISVGKKQNAPPERISIYCDSTYYLVNTATQEKAIMYSCV